MEADYFVLNYILYVHGEFTFSCSFGRYFSLMFNSPDARCLLWRDDDDVDDATRHGGS